MATFPPMTPVSAFGAQVTVHRDHVGFVIGPKYRAVNSIARDTKTRIQVNDTNKASPWVTFVIGGRSNEDVMAAHQRMLEVASRAEAATPRVGTNPPNNMFQVVPMVAYERPVFVAPEDVGMVLGGKGSTLRKTSSETWTWIKFLKGTAQTPPTFSVRGFLERDIEEATKRILSIAQESFNRRSGGPRHHRAGPTVLEAAGGFKMAPVPQSKRVSFKVKAQPQSPTYIPAAERDPQSPTYAPHSPTYAPPSPTYAPHSPTYAPHTPHTPRTPPSA